MVPAALDTALVDPLFGTASTADQPLSFAGHHTRVHDAAVTGALDTWFESKGLWDQA
jgi:hypothetical protein